MGFFVDTFVHNPALAPTNMILNSILFLQIIMHEEKNQQQENKQNLLLLLLFYITY